MPVPSAYPPASRQSGRHAAPRAGERPGGAAPAEARPEPAEETFRVASRDRLIPRQRGEAAEAPRVSYEVILALAIVVACMCGALAVGAAFTLQV